jgi:hypothetical protein
MSSNEVYEVDIRNALAIVLGLRLNEYERETLQRVIRAASCATVEKNENED